MKPGTLVLQDGTVFEGYVFGSDKPISSGEVVFHTAPTGYQEILSDPSYAGQIVTFAYPHIGNYGINNADNESRDIFARGVIVRDYHEAYSNYRATKSLDTWLKRANVAAITGIDTRKLTRHIREQGALPGAFGSASLRELKLAAKKEPGTFGIDLVKAVSTKKPYSVGSGKLRVTALDFGIKSSIISQLATFATVTILPADSTHEQVLASRPSGIFLSNGPGDPQTVNYGVETIRKLLGHAPIFGICLGHQLLATALGGKTVKMPFGHHGGNHPVQDLSTNVVEITTQNHNFAVVESSLKDVVVTHRNLNDNVVEGLRSTLYPAFSVQYHPEAGPGPHDARHLFATFKSLMEQTKRA
ncbi:MAG TPA: glutamine-hydrolyzing carbamoyl-phosphate synthase small subunit [Candidatus Dormibacteraeota bacterium]|nr:glutamine-hydrolyzing carbamoyl-phosphate synthase small subunit [Candidatus Dormibacteraeota bacterium]